MAGFNWHCSVQFSKVREPFAGVTACTKRNQAYMASPLASPAVGFATSCFAAGLAALETIENIDRSTAVNQTRLFMVISPIEPRQRGIRCRFASNTRTSERIAGWKTTLVVRFRKAAELLALLTNHFCKLFLPGRSPSSASQAPKCVNMAMPRQVTLTAQTAFRAVRISPDQTPQ